MPELPEVEWMAERLHRWAVNQPILKITTNPYPQYLPNQESLLEGQTIQEILRRGKYLLIRVERGFLIGHNAMSGFWDTKEDPTTFDYVEGARAPTDKDVHVQIELPNCTLRFHDARRFGFLEYYPCTLQSTLTESLSWIWYNNSNVHTDAINRLGWEPIRTTHNAPFSIMTQIWFMNSLRASKQSIKNYLMDQSQIAGIGNIYATEALWRSQIHPQKICEELSTPQISHLYGALQSILVRSIQVNLDYTKFLQVYRQVHCKACQSEIKRIQVGGRSTYFCPRCQVI